MNAVYPKALEQFLQAGLNLASGAVKAVLVNTTAGDGAGNFYTYSAAHEFLSDVPAGARIATTGANLGSKTFADGVFDADDASFAAVTGFTGEAIILYVDTGTAGTSRLFYYCDGRERVQVAVQANIGATSLVTEDLPGAIASGVVMTKVSGNGPTTLTTSGSAALAARSVAITAVSGSNVEVDAIYEYAVTGSGLPFTPNGGSLTVQWSAGADRIFRIGG